MRVKKNRQLIVALPNSRRSRIALASSLLLVLLLGTSTTYLVWPKSAPGGKPPVIRVPPTFQPVIGDVNDPEKDDPDITVQQSLIPGFQFRQGGYTLSGIVTDSTTGKPVQEAVVWIDLPPVAGQRSSNALHTVTDAGGNFSFSHLAMDTYTVVASRYYALGDGRYYAERVFPSVLLMRNRSNLTLPLAPKAAPGKRSLVEGRAKNLILLDLRGFYADSILNDPLLLNETQNLRTFLHGASVKSSVWQPYGWRPLDQYALLTGTYPAWATDDPWPHPVAWGLPDGIDTTFWFTGERNTHLFGQESIFDVAKGYGMQTNVVAGIDYMLSDATMRSLDLLQRSSMFAASTWLTQVKDAVVAGTQQSNGFLLYAELASLSADAASSSPDAQGDDYQQALLQADSTFGQLITWLAETGVLQQTLIVLTTSQAQANHTDADNYYGMGSTGQGTSKHTLLALSGPGVCAGQVDNSNMSSFLIAPTIMQALGLPAPAEARFHLPVSNQKPKCL